MKQCSVLPLLLTIWIISGCQTTQQDIPTPEDPLIEGLKISDLKDNTESIDEQLLMRFRVLTYTLVPDSVDKLKEVFDSLSHTDVRASNQKAFHANGFAIGTARFKQAAQVAKKLTLIGAVRTAHARLMFPPDSQETLSQTFLHPAEVIHYLKSANTKATLSQIQGFLGWVFSARPDSRLRGMALVKLFPAVWQPGNQNIRLVLGKEAIEYNPISAGQVLVRVEEGGVILLGPIRSVPEETTLDKKLFFVPGRRPKIRFYVIICEAVGV
jgi:hypothetical protein